MIDHRVSKIAALGLGFVLVTGCGVSTEGTSQSPSPTTFTASPLEVVSPLFGMGTTEQGRINAEAQTLIAQCMKDQGFEYDRPHIPDKVNPDGYTSPEQWAASYGYGVVEAYRTSDPAKTPAERSPVEEVEYDRALYGTVTDEDALEDRVSYNWEQEGCIGFAYHEATDGADEIMRDPRVTALFDAVNQAEIEVAASELALSLTDEWTGCMADTGYSNQTDPTTVASGFRHDLVAILAEDASDSVHDRAITELREREIATALADLDCQQAINYTDRYNQLLWAAHHEVVIAFSNEIDALNDLSTD